MTSERVSGDLPTGPPRVTGHSPSGSPRGSSAPASAPPPGAPTICLGEVRIEFICERPLDRMADADAFVPHLGGAAANVAVTAARHGAHVALAGGAGDDPWGDWLRERLAREGVELSLFTGWAGVTTPVAIVAVNASGEPTSQIHGEPAVVCGIADQLEGAMAGAAALYFDSGALVDAEDRDVTMHLREVGLELGRPVMFDPNLRLARWRSRAEAAAACNACVPGALLVRASAEEASVMTGEDDPERAALALVKAGARMVVITLGSSAAPGGGATLGGAMVGGGTLGGAMLGGAPVRGGTLGDAMLGGAMLRGQMRIDVPAPPAAVRSTIGAGEVLTGVLLARLARSGFYPPAVAASLPEAVEQATLACERWGALD